MIPTGAYTDLVLGQVLTSIMINTLKPRQNGCYFPDIFKLKNFSVKMIVFWCKFYWSLFLNIHLTNNSALAQIMAWRQSGDKLLSKPMMAYFTSPYMQPQWHIEAWINWTFCIPVEHSYRSLTPFGFTLPQWFKHEKELIQYIEVSTK